MSDPKRHRPIAFPTNNAFPRVAGPSEEDEVYAVAAILDRPSVYMGGPSQASMRKARQIVAKLREMHGSAA